MRNLQKNMNRIWQPLHSGFVPVFWQKFSDPPPLPPPSLPPIPISINFWKSRTHPYHPFMKGVGRDGGHSYYVKSKFDSREIDTEACLEIPSS